MTESFTLRTLGGFLIGRRAAILTVAHHRSSLLVGLLFVLSAGFAREYDGEDLLHEPWYALIPVGASLAAASLLFVVINVLFGGRWAEGARRAPLLAGYRAFLGVFWMTAPLAWLYAVPYEQMMSPTGAVETNLLTLAVVAGWRVALIIRAIAVLYGVPAGAVIAPVLLFANGLAVAVANLIPVPLLNVMGGVRHTGADQVIADAVGTLLFNSCLTIPALVVATLASVRWLRPKRNWPAAPTGGPARGPLALAVVALVAWIPVLPFTQPPQIARRHAERMLRSGAVGEAFAYMSERGRSAFPPHWVPPPRLAYGEREPSLQAIRLALVETSPAPWVDEIYADILQRGLWRTVASTWYAESWRDVADDVDGQSGWGLIELSEHLDEMRFLLDHHPTLSDDERAALESVIEAAVEVRAARAAEEDAAEDAAKDAVGAEGEPPAEDP